jgi:O-antigen/teichoic acid export membrane protein
MLGEQRACAAVYASAFAINLVLCIILIPRLGVMGAAIATATALVGESVLLFVVAKYRLGIHAFIWQTPNRAAPTLAIRSKAATG